MPYCVNCGVELSANDTKCPLCETTVVCPPNTRWEANEDALFPVDDVPALPRASKKSLLELITLAFIIPIPLLFFCNINISESITWSGYAVGGIILLYCICIVPLIPKKGNAIISCGLDAAVILAYLYFIEHSTGGTWFLYFALPLVLTIAVFGIVFSIVASTKKFSMLTLFGIGMLFLGLLCLCIEILLNIAFALRDELIWSIYPFIGFSFWAVILFYINRNTSLKEKLRRKFFI